MDEVERQMQEALRQMDAAVKWLFQDAARGMAGASRRPDSDSPFRALGLDPSAPDEVVKLVYRHLAGRLHPDRGGNAEDMAQLNQAYEWIAKERGWKP